MPKYKPNGWARDLTDIDVTHSDGGSHGDEERIDIRGDGGVLACLSIADARALAVKLLRAARESEYTHA